jgi:archaellin
MTTKRVFSSSLILSAVLTLSACGGSSNVDLVAVATEFSTKFNSAFSELTSSAGVNYKALTNLFDEKFLDGGFTKADLVNSLTATSTASATSPELSLFPMAAVTNSSLSGCDSNNICTLTGTLTNSDADTTSVDFSTKVISVGGVIYFYGDQSSTTSI